MGKIAVTRHQDNGLDEIAGSRRAPETIDGATEDAYVLGGAIDS